MPETTTGTLREAIERLRAQLGEKEPGWRTTAVLVDEDWWAILEALEAGAAHLDATYNGSTALRGETWRRFARAYGYETEQP